jgi:lysozyme
MKRLLACVVVLPALAGAAACSDSAREGECVGSAGDALKVCAGPTTVPGIDVSAYQGNVDWVKVKAAGKQFAFVRVSDGKNSLDSKFGANWKNTKSAGVIRGTYQFFRPSQDPIVQADLLLSELSKNGGLQVGDLPPVLDLESTDGLAAATVVSKAKQWLSHVEAALGVKPIVYTAAFMSSTLGNNFGGYTLWVANYGTTCPTMPSGWSKWAFWQSSDSGTVAGIAGNVDLDVFDGSIADLKKLTVQAKPSDAGAPKPDGGADAGGGSAGDAGVTPAEAGAPSSDPGSAMGAGKGAAPPPPVEPGPAPDPCAP